MKNEEDPAFETPWDFQSRKMDVVQSLKSVAIKVIRDK